MLRYTLFLTLAFATSLHAQLLGPERTVTGNVIVSQRDPNIRIELPKPVHYVGADRFVLYDIADCEIHAFVEAGSDKNVQRLYWVQFEGYLPVKPDLHHAYDSPRHANIGGLDFYIDTWVRNQTDSTTSGSDLEHIQALIRSKGYKLPTGMMSVRLVHLLDEQKRKELMIIYSEDVAFTGSTAADLKPGGKAHDHWPAIEKSLIDRAEKSLQIRP